MSLPLSLWDVPRRWTNASTKDSHSSCVSDVSCPDAISHLQMLGRQRTAAGTRALGDSWSWPHDNFLRHHYNPSVGDACLQHIVTPPSLNHQLIGVVLEGLEIAPGSRWNFQEKRSFDSAGRMR